MPPLRSGGGIGARSVSDAAAHQLVRVIGNRAAAPFRLHHARAHATRPRRPLLPQQPSHRVRCPQTQTAAFRANSGLPNKTRRIRYIDYHECASRHQSHRIRAPNPVSMLRSDDTARAPILG
eukprot:1194708-Prorocentrum_minimum.AAC.12